MSFKKFYEEHHIFDGLLLEETTPEEKTDVEQEAKKAGLFDKLKNSGILKAIGRTKEKLSSKEARRSIGGLGKILLAMDGVSAAFKGGGAKGTSGGGIFTSILRYNNPVLRKIHPEKITLDTIEDIVKKLNFKADGGTILDLIKKMDFKSDPSKILTMAKFKIMFTKFLKSNPLPDEDTYEYLHDILSEITGLNVTKKDIRNDMHTDKLPPQKKKETAAQKKKREADNKKGRAAEKLYIKEWNKKFIEFLDNDKWNSEVHIKVAPLFVEFGIKIKMNTEEIKEDLGKLFSKIFSREVLQFIASLSKVAKNFVIVAISVYLMKIIKRIAFK